MSVVKLIELGPLLNFEPAFVHLFPTIEDGLPPISLLDWPKLMPNLLVWVFLSELNADGPFIIFELDVSKSFC